MNKSKNSENESESAQLKSKSKPIIFNYTLQDIIIGSILLIGVPLLVSYLFFNYQYSQTTLSEQKNLANGYISDLENVNRTLEPLIRKLDDPQDPDYHKPQFITVSLYPSWGLYYSNRQDIQKFDKTVSVELYDFYYELLTAEDARIFFNNYDTLYPIDTSRISEAKQQNSMEVQLKAYAYVYDVVHICYNKRIPQLITHLKAVRDS